MARAFVFIACVSFLMSRSAAYEAVNIKNVSQPESNAPLNTKLAYYRLAGWNNEDPNLTHGFFPVGCGANLSVHYSQPTVYGNLTGTDEKPVLLLTHGYPESSYIWRRTTQAHSERVPLLVVDVRGLVELACTMG